ncbi:MAG TPA: hypothetical protein DCP91_13195 [Eggerthellaceae bacterium]|nr:hypothetical protein [Eggerthellaceae bacterium]
MTLEELYALIGEDYEQAMKVLRKEKLLDRYVRRLPDNELCAALVAAGDQMDETALYENAHALKGVCANLGLGDLAAASSDITEEFRPGNARRYSDEEVRQKLAALETRYGEVIAGIQRYMNA